MFFDCGKVNTTKQKYNTQRNKKQHNESEVLIMRIKEVEYPVKSKHKFIVEDNKDTYICYLCSFQSALNCVINTKTNENITETLKGAKIMLECWKNM